MKSWKTTLFGALTALGVYLSTAAGVPEWAHGLGKAIEMIGPALIGFFARDNSVSSEQAGVK